MKILKNNIESFIKGIAKEKCKGIKLFGSDIGVLMAREAEIIKQLKSFEIIKLDLNAENTLSNIFSESFTDSFFSNSKLIICTGSPAKFAEIEAVTSKIDANSPHFLLIVITENLDAKSKLRKLFEESSLLASIACFPDEEYDILNIIKSFLAENKLTADLETVRYIAIKLSGNREILNLELEKLKTYKGFGKLTLAEVKAVISETEEGDIFETINHFFSLNFKVFLSESRVLMEENLPVSAIISGLINYHFKLIEILEEKEEKKKTVEALLAEKFIFFKQIPKMKDHLSKWNKEMLNNLSFLLLETEIEARKNFERGYELLTILAVKGRLIQAI